MNDNRSLLDPDDWDQFRAAAHKVLDECITFLQSAREHPWIPVPEAQKQRYTIGELNDQTALPDRLLKEILPYGTGNTHPSFFGWVHGTGLASGLLSEMVAATMNANCGGRDHGAVYLERAVIDWSRHVVGLPSTASGILVAGTSQASVIALAAARTRTLGPDVRKSGQGGQKLTVYASQAAHSCIKKAVELLGIGSDNLKLIPLKNDQIDLDHLYETIAADRRQGAIPMCVVGTAGSVNIGAFDNLNALADCAKKENLWFHVDGAFGTWTRLADRRWQRLSDGIERADSVACDFHKWMYVPYDCGLVLIRHESEHRGAFAGRPDYLEGQIEGLGGGDPWYCDYGIDLSRSNRALKVWTALETHGAEKLGSAINRNCELAAYMGDCLTAYENLQLVRPVYSNIVVFTAAKDEDPARQSTINTEISQALQMSGDCVFSTTKIDGCIVLRAAIVNHRTCQADVESAIEKVADASTKALSHL